MVRFKAAIPLSTIDDAIVATLETLGHERLDPSPGGIIKSVTRTAGYEEGDWDLW